MFGRYDEDSREAALQKVANFLALTEKEAAVSPAAVRSGVKEVAKNPSGVWKFLTTPFRNISEGYSDYSRLANVRDTEVAALKSTLQEAAAANTAGKATPEITDAMAKKIWSKSQPIEGATTQNTQQLLSEARGRMIAGGLQVGIPTVAGGLYLKSKLKKEPPVRADVPYNLQGRPPVYVITRNGVHYGVPDTELQYLQKTSAAVPEFEGAITGVTNVMQKVKTPTLGQLRKSRGMPTTGA